MKKILLIFLLLMVPLFSFAETVILKSGQRIEGRIIEKTNEYVKVDFQGIVLTYFSDEINGIEGLKNSFLAKGPPLSRETKIYKDRMDIFRDFRDSIVRIVGEDLEQKKFSGTGFVIDQTGIVATNYHVVYNAKSIEIITTNQKRYSVEYIIAFSPEDDFCILKVPCSFEQSFYIGDSSLVKQGDIIFALGFLDSENILATNGSYLRKGRIWDSEIFYTSLATNFGCSGGPVINIHGEVIGIAQAVSGDEFSNENVSIPINKIKDKIGLTTRFPLSSLHVSSPFMKLSRAQFYYYFKDFAKALFYLDELFHVGTVNSEAYLTRGMVYYKLSKHKEALDDFNASIKLDPSNASAYCYRGLVYRENGSYDKSIADFNRAIEINPNDSAAYCNRGVSYDKKGSFDQAISDYNKAIEIDPHSTEAYNNRGAAYHQKGNFDQAMSDYNRALEINPRFAEAYNGRAIIYFEKKQFNEAWSEVHKAESLGCKVHLGFLEALKKASGRQN